jgi:hypothetical protein
MRNIVCKPLLAATALALALGMSRSAMAEDRSSYNHQIDGITVNFDGATVDVSQLFGFSTSGNTLHFVGDGTYALNDVRKFVLLYDTVPATGVPSPQNTASAIGNVGTPQVWTSSSDTSPSGAFYGWETTNGTLKDGQFAPSASGFDTTKVFSLLNPLSGDGSANLVGFGFDVSISGTAGQASPFGTFDDQGNSTGFVYENLDAIPEPAFYQMSVFLAGGGLIVLRARRRRQA